VGDGVCAGRATLRHRTSRARPHRQLSTSTSEVALTLDDVFRQGEAGLLGLALARIFAATRLVYLYYTAVEGNGAVNRIVRYREAGGRRRTRQCCSTTSGATIHDGGRLVRTGRSALATPATPRTARTRRMPPRCPASFYGSIATASAPGQPVRVADLQLGPPQPQGFDWHPATGEIWATEHGNSGNDENQRGPRRRQLRLADDRRGADFPNMERPSPRSSRRSRRPCRFYQGTRFPQFVGNFFAGTLRGTHLLRLSWMRRPRGDRGRSVLLDGTFGACATW
jgi:glucose/arabinose dehydrogenase